jgi:predicted oxidoreductase
MVNTIRDPFRIGFHYHKRVRSGYIPEEKTGASYSDLTCLVPARVDGYRYAVSQLAGGERICYQWSIESQE